MSIGERVCQDGVRMLHIGEAVWYVGKKDGIVITEALCEVAEIGDMNSVIVMVVSTTSNNVTSLQRGEKVRVDPAYLFFSHQKGFVIRIQSRGNMSDPNITEKLETLAKAAWVRKIPNTNLFAETEEYYGRKTYSVHVRFRNDLDATLRLILEHDFHIVSVIDWEFPY
jgi:hypothetical protein